MEILMGKKRIRGKEASNLFRARTHCSSFKSSQPAKRTPGANDLREEEKKKTVDAEKVCK